MVRYKVFRVEIKKEETATVRYAGRKGLLLQAKSANANPPSKYIAHSGAIIMPRIYLLRVYFFLLFSRLFCEKEMPSYICEKQFYAAEIILHLLKSFLQK